MEAVAAARLAVKGGEGSRLIQVSFPYTQWMGAENYLEKYGPEERYNLLKFVDRLRCPAWFAYGERELSDGSLAFAGVPEALRQARRADQALETVTVPNADHNYSGTVPALAEPLLRWLTSGPSV